MAGADLTLIAADGRALGARLYTPGRADGPAVVIAGATGVLQAFYGRLAEWLADRGATVLTFDYRGIGRSRHSGGLRRDTATMREWGNLDLNEAIGFLAGFLADREPGRPIAVVGHSAGGWLASFAPNTQLATAMITVGSQNLHWKQWTGTARLTRYVQFHVGMPLVTRLTGTLPGRTFGGESLPGGVARDWARYGRRVSFVEGAGALPAERRFAGRLLAVSVPGDRFAPERAVRRLPDLYPRATSAVHHLDERHRPLGHFGAFRPAAEPLWMRAWDWLRRSSVAPGRLPY